MLATDQRSSSSFLLYTLLPSLVQKRIPKLRALQRAISNYDTPCHGRISSQCSVDSVTPPPSYVSNAADDLEDVTDDPPVMYRIPSVGILPSSSRPSSSRSAAPLVEQDCRSGVQWKYADPGFALLSLASQEASSAALSPHLIRRQYIDGVACMLRGLPSDLTADEELSLREALPARVLSDVQRRAEDGTMVPRSGIVSSSSSSSNTKRLRRPGNGSALQRSVATLTLYVLLLIAFVMPYVQLFLAAAYRYDRKHKISARVLAGSVVAADAVGKRTLTLASNFCALNDGKVGDVVRETGVYLVQGFSGGVYDGLGEALRRRADEEFGSGSGRGHDTN